MTFTRDQRERWLSRLAYLEENFPPGAPIRVHRRKIAGGHSGDCTRREDGSFYIRVCPTLPFHLAVDTLCHEWAHALTWDMPGPAHGKFWGLMYSDLYVELIDQW